MKKRFFLLVLALSLLLTACRQKSEVRAQDLFYAIEEAITLPDCEIYTYLPDASHDTLLARLYNPEKVTTSPAALSLCDDYCICLYKGDRVWELHIFRTVSIYDNDRVIEMLLSRRDLLQNSENYAYYSEEDLGRIASAVVLEYRNYVLLAVTDENDAIKNTLHAFV